MFSPRRYCGYRIYLGCFLFYSSFSQPCHTSPCWPPPMSAVASWSTFSQLCPILAEAVRGWLPPGRSASASVPELSSSRHAAWLNFADFRSSGDLYCVSYPVIHNSLWHRRLVCTCRGSQLFGGVGKQFVSVILLIDDSLGVVCSDAFVLRKIPSRSMFWWCMMTDIDIWKHTWVAIFVSVKSNLQIKQNKNHLKNWILLILQSWENWENVGILKRLQKRSAFCVCL